MNEINKCLDASVYQSNILNDDPSDTLHDSHPLLDKYFPNSSDKISSVQHDLAEIKNCISAMDNIISTAKSTIDITQGVTAASHLATTLFLNKWTRQAMFIGTMYAAGGTIISTVGILPVIATGAALYWIS